VKVGVCLKQVPVSDSRIKIGASGAGIDMAEIKFEINAYDENALEEALKLKDGGKATEVVVLTLGGAGTETMLRDALARGADRAVRLDDPSFAGADSLGVAKALAAVVQSEGLGLVLCGRHAMDDDNAQVPAMVAELLGWAQATVVSQLELGAGSFKAWRAAGGGVRDIVEGSLPAVISADKGLNTPRSANLKGIMAAKKKAITVLSADKVGVGNLGASAVVKLTNFGLPPARPTGKVLRGEPAAMVKELVSLLRNEAKVI